MLYIVKSNKQNWSGKEFSTLPAKLYTSVEAAAGAVSSYQPGYTKAFSIKPITQANAEKLSRAGKVRF